MVIVNVGMSKEKSRVSTSRHEDNGVVEGGKSVKFVSGYFDVLRQVGVSLLGLVSPCQWEATSVTNMYFSTKDSRFHHKGKMFSEELKLKGYVCPMNIDYLEFYSKLYPSRIRLSNLSIAGGDLYQCEIRQSDRCDSDSMCSTDECHCTNKGTSYQDQVMFCPRKDGGKACIAFHNVCNGIVDCADHSDECLCQDSYELFCDKLPQIKRIFLPKFNYCRHLPQIKELNCSNLPTNINCTEIIENSFQNNRPFVECLHKIANLKFKLQTDDKWVLKYGESLAETCITQCTNTTELEKWKLFCQNIDFQRNEPYFMVFKCENDTNNSYPVTFLCDGTIQCSNSADELDCPGRFYCSVDKTVTWINESLVCDRKKDCTNGKDECSGCTVDGSVSFEFMVESKIMAALATFGGLSIMIINISIGLKNFHENPTSKAAQIDRILRLSICFYDFLMGVYLFFMIVASIVLKVKGDYCQSDEDWRASISCMMLGVTFSVSSHGSLTVIGIMSILRCLKCSMGFSFELSTKTVKIVTAIVFLLGFIHSIVPILPIHQLQNFFRTSMILTAVDKNPFIKSREGPDMIQNVQRIHSHYFNNSSSTDTIRILADLRNANITSDNTIFDVADIGYYGNTPLCISNVFKVEGNYHTYKIVYCVVVALLLTAITASYIIIVVKARSSRQQAGPVNNDNTSQLTLKLSLMIISQLISWVSFIAAVIILDYTGKNPPAKVFDIFALIVIPINSLLNPIFYSTMYKNITSYLWTSGKKGIATIKERVQYRVDNEIELQINNSNANLGTLPRLQKVQTKPPMIAEHSKCVPSDDQPTSPKISGHSKSVPPNDQPTSPEIVEHSKSVPPDDQPTSPEIVEHSKNFPPCDRPNSPEIVEHSKSVPPDDQPTSPEIVEHSKSDPPDDQPTSPEIVKHSKSDPPDDQPTSPDIVEHSKNVFPDDQPTSPEIVEHTKSVLPCDQPTSPEIVEHSKSFLPDDQPTSPEIVEHTKSFLPCDQPTSPEIVEHSKSFLPDDQRTSPEIVEHSKSFLPDDQPISLEIVEYSKSFLPDDQPTSPEIVEHPKSVLSDDQPTSPEILEHSKSVPPDHQPTSPEIVEHSKSVLPCDQPTSPEIVEHSKNVLPDDQPTSPEIVEHSKSFLPDDQPTSPEIVEHSKSVLPDDQPISPEIVEHSKSVLPCDQPISPEIVEHNKSVLPDDQPTSPEIVEHSKSVPPDDQPTSPEIVEHSKSVLPDDQPTSLEIVEHSKNVLPCDQPTSPEIVGHSKSFLPDDQPTSPEIVEHSKSFLPDDQPISPEIVEHSKSFLPDDQPTSPEIVEHSKRVPPDDHRSTHLTRDC